MVTKTLSKQKSYYDKNVKLRVKILRSFNIPGLKKLNMNDRVHVRGLRGAKHIKYWAKVRDLK